MAWQKILTTVFLLAVLASIAPGSAASDTSNVVLDFDNPGDTPSLDNVVLEFSVLQLEFINVSMTLNGLAASRKYEFGSNLTVNVTQHGNLSISCFSIGGLANVTCSNQSFGFNFALSQFNLTGWDDGTNASKLFSLNATHRRERNPRVDAIGGIIDLDAIDSVRDLAVLVNGQLSNIIRGNITRKTLSYDRFNAGLNESVTFTAPSTKTIILNISKRNLINGTAFMYGIATNPEEFNSTEEFINYSRIDSALSTPGAAFTVWETFDQEVSGRWNFNEEDDGVTRTQVDDANSYLEIFLDDDIDTPGGGPANTKEWHGRGNSVTFNASRFERFEVAVTQSASVSCADDGVLCSGGTQSSGVYITDDNSGTNRHSRSIAAVDCFCGFTTGTGSYSGRYLYERLPEGRWNVTPSGQPTSTTAPLGDKIEVGALIDGSGFTTAENDLGVTGSSLLLDINVSAFGTVNESPTAWAGSFNLTSGLLFESGENLTSARIDAYFLDEDSQGNILLYLSVDNGTTWDNVQNHVLHFFTHEGNQLKFRVEGNQTQFDKPIGVYEVSAAVTTGFARDLQFDIGNNGTVDLYMPGEVNTTNSPVPLNFTREFADEIDRYVLDSCDSPFYCEVPIGITSNNSGVLEIRDLLLNTTLNPVSLNASMLDIGCGPSLCDWNITLRQDSHIGSVINATRLAIDIIGDLNVSVKVEAVDTTADNDSTTEQNFTVFIRYSKFNFTQDVPVFFFAPTTPNSKNVEPFGQSSRHNRSVINISSLSKLEDFTVEIALNESVGTTCVAQYVGRSPSQSGMVRINLTHAEVYAKLSGNFTVGSSGHRIYSWANFTACNASIVRYVDPIEFMESICSECVQWHNITGGF